MKKIFYPLFLLSILFVVPGCEKNVPEPAYSELVGKWGYTGTSCKCEISNSSSPSESTPGTLTVLNFTPKSYLKFVNHTQSAVGTYTVVSDTLNNQTVNRIIYDGNSTAPRTFYRLAGGVLTFYTSTPVGQGGIETTYNAE